MNKIRGQWDSCIEAGRMAYEKGCYLEADQILSRTMEKLIDNLKQGDMAHIDLLLAYARVKRELNQFEDALSLYYRALSILKREDAEQKMMTIKIVEEIATCYCLMGKFHQAREKEKCILSHIDKTFGVESQEADECVIRLACLSWVMGDMDSCGVYLQRHLRESKKFLKGATLVSSMTLLAHAFYSTGEFDEAERLFRDAMSLLKEHGGMEKELSILGNELGMAICATGRHEEARTICQKSAEMRTRQQNGSAVRSQIDTLNDLADAYCEKGDFESARKLCQDADALRWEAPLDNTAACLSLYSRLLKHLGAIQFTRRIDRRARELAQAA